MWVSQCFRCGAEEPLEAMFGRIIDDEAARRAIADVVRISLPLGQALLRYISLHKPPKQKLRMARAHELIVEVATDMARNVIERHGRAWALSQQDWQAAFEAVFDAVDKGTLQLPLQGNGYLYQVLTRMANQAEAKQEQQREQDRRVAPQRDTVQVRGQAMGIGDALQVVYAGKDPALVDVVERSRKAAPMPDHVRERLAQIKKGGPQ